MARTSPNVPLGIHALGLLLGPVKLFEISDHAAVGPNYEACHAAACRHCVTIGDESVQPRTCGAWAAAGGAPAGWQASVRAGEPIAGHNQERQERRRRQHQ